MADGIIAHVNPGSSIGDILIWIEAITTLARNLKPNGILYGLLSLVADNIYTRLPNAVVPFALEAHPGGHLVERSGRPCPTTYLYVGVSTLDSSKGVLKGDGRSTSPSRPPPFAWRMRQTGRLQRRTWRWTGGKLPRDSGSTRRRGAGPLRRMVRCWSTSPVKLRTSCDVWPHR
jgi:hypothetical protein